MTRVLPPQEWVRLTETDFAPLLAELKPSGVTIVVAEDAEGAIVGCWGLIAFMHVEGLWIAPAHRKRGRVLLRLWQAMCQLAGRQDVRAVFTGAMTDDVRRLLEARGAQPLPPQYLLSLTRSGE